MAYYIFFLPLDLRYKITALAIVQETQSMKLVTFTHNKQSRVGAVIDDPII